jgi:hypothetical protein
MDVRAEATMRIAVWIVSCILLSCGVSSAADNDRPYLGKSKLATLVVENWKLVESKPCGYPGAIASQYQVNLVVKAALPESAGKTADKAGSNRIVATLERAEPEANTSVAPPARSGRLSIAATPAASDERFDGMGYPNWFPLRRGATFVAAYDGATPNVAEMEFLPDDKQYPLSAIWRDCKRFQTALDAAQDSKPALDAALAKAIGGAENPLGYALFRLAVNYDRAVADGPQFCHAAAAYLVNRRIPLALRTAVPPELWNAGSRSDESQQALLAAQLKLLDEAKNTTRGAPYAADVANQLYTLYLQEPFNTDQPLPAIDGPQHAFLRTLLTDAPLAASVNFDLKEVVMKWLDR